VAASANKSRQGLRRLIRTLDGARDERYVLRFAVQLHRLTSSRAIPSDSFGLLRWRSSALDTDLSRARFVDSSPPSTSARSIPERTRNSVRQDRHASRNDRQERAVPPLSRDPPFPAISSASRCYYRARARAIMSHDRGQGWRGGPRSVMRKSRAIKSAGEPARRQRFPHRFVIITWNV